MKRWWWGVLGVLALPASPIAQDPPAIEVTSISTSPGTFQPGGTVTFSIEVRNTGSRRTRPGTAYLDVFAGERLHPSELVWGATQEVGRIEPGASEVVDFVWRSELRGAIRTRTWKVPAIGAEAFVVRAGVVESPGSFAAMKVARFARKVTYARTTPIAAAPRASAADLKRLPRPNP